MAAYGHCGVRGTASERHVRGRHPTTVGGGLPSGSPPQWGGSRRPTALIIHAPSTWVYPDTVRGGLRVRAHRAHHHHRGARLSNAYATGYVA